MSARGHVAGALTAALSSFRVIAYPADLDGVRGPTAVVYRESVKPGSPLGFVTSTLSVWVLVPQQDPRDAEDPLDDSLTAVLEVLDGDTTLSWSEAERGVYADKWPAYRITVTIIESR